MPYALPRASALAALAPLCLSLVPGAAHASEAPATLEVRFEASHTAAENGPLASKRKRTISFSSGNRGAAMSGSRFFLDWLFGTAGALLTGAVTAPFLASYGACGVEVSNFPRLPGCTTGDALWVTGLTLFLGGSPFAAAGFATLMGNAHDGAGSFWWSLLGASVGTGVGAAFVGAGSATNSSGVLGFGMLAVFAFPGFGAALAYEFSSAATLRPAPTAPPPSARRRSPERAFRPVFSLNPLLTPRDGSAQPRVDGVGVTVGGAF